MANKTKNNVLEKYQLSRGEIVKSWLTNYEMVESLQELTAWTKFYAINEFVKMLVTCKEKKEDESFIFHLCLD